MNSSSPVAQGHAARLPVMDSRPSLRRRAARGFTLVEMLVALAITLIMMGAVVTLFGVISESVSGSRSAIELSDRLRAARNQLQLDLAGATATMKPPLRPENDEGYFEIIEGWISDNNTLVTLFGDVDDVLMFTTRSRGAPFRGRFQGGGLQMIESPVAEVVYFLVQNGPVIDATTATPTRLCTLYRRVFLVVPKVGSITTFTDEFYDYNDVSVRYELSGTAGVLYPNTLGDLTKRENRFAHYGRGYPTPSVNYGVFPFPVDLTAIPQNPPATPTVPSNPTNWPTTAPAHPLESAFIAPAEHLRLGDDVLLTNVLAFDVQVWDPTAPIKADASGQLALEPHDPGWAPGLTTIASGAYVDLGYSPTGAVLSVFDEVNPDARPTTAFPTGASAPRVYDTWSLHYESDGINQNGGTADKGTNGFDDGGVLGVVDDVDEYDTRPPYNVPLRGIRVTIRVYEPDSQQVREAVVIQDFLPD